MFISFKVKFNLLVNLIIFAIIMLVFNLFIHNFWLSLFIGTIWLSFSFLIMYVSMGNTASKLEPRIENSWVYAVLSKDGTKTTKLVRYLELRELIRDSIHDGYEVESYKTFNFLWEVDGSTEKGKQDLSTLEEMARALPNK